MKLAATSLVALLLCGTQARADGFALDTWQPSAAGDRFFTAPDADVRDSGGPLLGISSGYTHLPLVLYSGNAQVPNGRLVQDQLTLRLGVAVPISNLFLFDADVGLSAWQHGQSPFTGQSAVAGNALLDPRLGARVALLRDERLNLAAGLSVWLPVGNQDGFGSDGALRAEPAVIASGRAGELAWSSNLGVELRKAQDAQFTRTGSGVRAGGAVGWLFRDGTLQVGPEIYSRVQLNQAANSTLEALLGARLNQGDFSIGAAVGSRLFHDAPGAAPLRVIAQITFTGLDLLQKGRRTPQVGGASQLLSTAAPAPVAPAPVAAPPPAAPAPAPEEKVALKEPTPEVQQTVKAKEVEIPAGLSNPALFGFARANLNRKARSVLESTADLLLAHPEIELVLVAGYADDRGSVAANERITTRRAETVRAFLVERGVAPGRVSIRGCGSVNPVASNKTKAGRAKNRRAVVLPAKGSVLPACEPRAEVSQK